MSKKRPNQAKAFNRSSWRRIGSSLGRFLSIVLISAVGIGFFGGVNSTGGAMLASARRVFEEQELGDLRVISPLGFRPETLDLIRQNPDFERIDEVFFTDLYISHQDRNAVVRFFSLPDPDGLNQLKLAEGRLPENDNEIVLDISAKQNFDLELGNVVKWSLPGDKGNGISLSDLGTAFDSEQDSDQDQPEGSQPADGQQDSGKAPETKFGQRFYQPGQGVRSLGVLDRLGARPRVANDQSNQLFRKMEDSGGGSTEPGQASDLADQLAESGFDLELPPALKELAELDFDRMEDRFQGKGLSPEDQELMDLDAEAILADDSDALIQLAQAIGDRELKSENYTIVGFVTSPVYITFERDVSNLGVGKIDYNAYVKKSEFKLSDPPLLAIKVKGSEQFKLFSQEYEDLIRPYAEELNDFGNEDLSTRTRDIRQSLTEKQDLLTRAKSLKTRLLTEGEAELNRVEQLLSEAKPELEDLEKDLGQKIKDLEDELAAGKDKMSDARMQYQSGLIQYQEAKTSYELKGLELSMAENQLQMASYAMDMAQSEINTIQPLIYQINTEINQLQNQIAVIENQLKNLPVTPSGQVDPAAWDQIIANIEWVSPELAEALRGINPSDPNAGSLTKQALANALASAKSMSKQAQAISSYYQQRLNMFLGQISMAQANMEEKKQLVKDGKQAWQDGGKRVDKAKADLNYASSQISAGEKALVDGERKLIQGKDRLNRELVTATLRLENGTQQLAEARHKFEAEKQSAEHKIELADQALLEADQLIAKLPSSWFVYERKDNPGYSSLQGDVDRISAVAKVFPLFLFLVAALVCLTTMTRLVEEDRTEIGLLKALGYPTRLISLRYLRYAFLATLAGGLIGSIIGPLMFPSVIMSSYSNLYQSIDFRVNFEVKFALIACLMQMIFTLSATYFASRTELVETPAGLLQPKAPKPGKRIFLEKIPFIWQKLSFTHKLTARNIFRYKSRMTMIIAGISGCTALLLAAFGIHNSIYDMRDKQFDELWHMDGMAILNDQGVEDGENLLNQIYGISGLARVLPVSYESMILEPSQKADQESEVGRDSTITLLVAEDSPRFQELITLRDQSSGKNLSMPQDGLILTQKIAKELGYEPGDRVVLKDSDGRKYTSVLEAVTEHYILHYAYMSPRAYQKMTFKPAKFNSVYFSYNQNIDQPTKNETSESLLSLPGVLAINNMDTTKNEVTNMISSIAAVVLVLVATAAALAFIVLYNLANINIAERVREIATFRVLGFHNTEVALYIFREMTILTVLGDILGLGLGVILHQFIIKTMEVDAIAFGSRAHLWSYLLAFVLTIIFGQIVNAAMYFKIRKINMVEALKGVE